MDQLIVVLSIAVILGSGVVAGIFFAFSTFVMRALARLPAAHGIAAMQSINITVINPLFMTAFMGTALLSVAAMVTAFLRWGEPWVGFHVGGGMCYVVGTFLVTGLGNVPLNDELASVTSDDVKAEAVWRRYLTRWTMLNHVRTAAAAVAAVLFCVGLIRLVVP